MAIEGKNPAARLFNVIARLSSMPQSQPAFQAWGALLALRPDDTFELLDRIGRIMQLPKITKDILSAVKPPLAPIYFEWAAPIETAFKAHRLAGHLQEFLTPITSDARKTLQFCADRLSDIAPQKLFEIADLAKLRQEAAVLRSELEKAEIAPDLKKFGLHHLKEVITALEDYDFFGTIPLQRASEGALGAAGLNRETVVKLQATAVGKKLFGFLVKLLVTLAALHGAAQIPHDIQHYLIDARPTLETSPSDIQENQPSAKPAADGTPAIEIVSRATEEDGSN